MLAEISKILTVIGLSSFKFFVGAPLAFGFGFSFLKTLILVTSGGWLGVLLFYFFGTKIDAYFNNNSKIKYRKKFTFKNKLILKIRQKTGLIGVVAITAPLITIPVGVRISIQLFSNKKKILTYHLIGILIWGIIFTVFFKYAKDLIFG